MFSLLAQPPALKFEKLNETHGLSSNYVNCVLQDSKGYLWVGTRDGLNRYDGYTFKVYKSTYGDAKTLPSAFITSIYEDKNQVLWVGTEGGGLAVYNGKLDYFTSVSFNHRSQPISDVNIQFILEDSFRNLWIGFYRGGVVRYNRENESYLHYRVNVSGRQHIHSDEPLSMLQGKDGKLWLLTHSGLNVFDFEKNTFIVV
jgi:ligand-binding sensor domain-containing protein